MFSHILEARRPMNRAFPSSKPLSLLGVFLLIAVLGACTQPLRLTVNLNAAPSTISQGELSVLNWSVRHGGIPLSADDYTAVLAPGELDVTGSTRLSVSPSATTEYTLTVSHGEASSVAKFTIIVAPPPDPDPEPVATAPQFTSTPRPTAVGGLAYSYTATTAPQAAPVTLSAASLPHWLSFTDNGDGSGVLAGVPADEDAGEHEVTLIASDGELESEQTFSIAVAANTAPVVTVAFPGDGAVLVYGDTVTLSATVDDEEPDLAASVGWSSDLDGELGAGAPLENVRLSVGTHTVTASVSDTQGLTGTASVTVTVEPRVAGFDTLLDAATSAEETVSRGATGTVVRRLIGMRVVLDGTFDLERLGVVFSDIGTAADGQTAALAIYTHNQATNAPGTFVVETASRTIDSAHTDGNGVFARTIAPPFTLEPGTYWIVLRISLTSDNRSVSLRYTDDTSYRRFSVSGSSNIFPETFPTVTPTRGAYNLFAHLH
jgi:hypothetical protein